jgi:cytidine deaminase
MSRDLRALPMMVFSMADSASPCGAVRQSMMAMCDMNGE